MSTYCQKADALAGNNPNWPVVSLPKGIASAYAGASIDLDDLCSACALLYLAADVIDDAQDEDLSPEFAWADAVNAGLALLFRSLQLCSQLASPAQVSLEFSQAGWDLVVGQTLDLSHGWEARPSEGEVLRSLNGKAGASTRLYARIAAICTGRPDDEVDTWGEFGLALGLALQLRTDLVDLTGPNSRDFRNKKTTLPVAYALARSPQFAALLETSPDHLQAIASLRSSGAITYAEFKIDGYARQALEILMTLNLREQAQEYLIDVIDSIKFESNLRI